MGKGSRITEEVKADIIKLFTVDGWKREAITAKHRISYITCCNIIKKALGKNAKRAKNAFVATEAASAPIATATAVEATATVVEAPAVEVPVATAAAVETPTPDVVPEQQQ